MEVNGHCQACGHSFDAHWHKTGTLFPACPACGSKKVTTTTDESHDFESPRGDDEEEIETC